MANAKPTFAVIGGGIVGMVSALAASDLGSVTLFDPALGQGATYAAAGMLSPGAELLAGEVHALPEAIRSHVAWKEFAVELGLPTSDFEFGAGSVLTGLTQGDVAEVTRLTTAASTAGIPLKDVYRNDDPSVFSGMAPRFVKGVYFPEDSFIDVDQLVAHLATLLNERGVVIDQREVASLEIGAGRFETSDGISHSVGRGMVCTGAALALVREHSAFPVRSVRGVTVRLRRRGDFQPRMVRAFIDGRMIYVVERADGNVIVGASSDESSERYVDALAVSELLRLAIQLIPSLDQAEFMEARSGLRPVGPSGQPFLERLSANWSWHSGYYRHGVLMAPLAYRRAKEYWND